MKDTLYITISRIIEKVSELDRNISLVRDNPEVVKNFLLMISMSALHEKTRRKLERVDETLNLASDIQELCIENLKDLYSFPGDLVITRNELVDLCRLSGKYEEQVPAAIFEYFLDKSGKSDERKNEGVYYTPTWVVKDIVEHSLSALMEKHLASFREARDITDSAGFVRQWQYLDDFRVLDPASGCGIFLIEAFREFEEFYKKLGYIAETLLNNCDENCFPREERFSPDHRDLVGDLAFIKSVISKCQHPGRMIVEKHLYGCDVDPESVRYTSAILRVFAYDEYYDEESTSTNVLQQDFIEWIGNDKTSFDAIIGNPPYFTIGGGGKGREKTKYHTLLKEHHYFGEHFRSQSDIFYYFIIGGLKLLKPGGILSFIVPSYWLENEYADKLRSFILKESNIEEIIDFTPHKVFETLSGKLIGVDTSIFRFVKKSKMLSMPAPPFPVFRNPGPLSQKEIPENAEKLLWEIRSDSDGVSREKVNALTLGSGKWVLTSKTTRLSFTVKDGVEIFPLGDILPLQKAQYPDEFIDMDDKEIQGICDIGQGQEAGFSRAFTVSMEKAAYDHLEPQLLRPLIKSRHIRKWYIEPSHLLLITTRDTDDIDMYPNIKKHLEFYRDILEKRQRVVTGQRKWYSLSIPQNMELFENNPKILVPYRASDNQFALDKNGYFNDSGDVRALAIKPKWRKSITYEYLLALLNSSLVGYWYQQAGKKKGEMFEFFSQPMSRIPVKIPPMKIQRRIAELVGVILEKMDNRHSPDDPCDVEEQEKEINSIIYSIYKVTEEELKEKVNT
jgi:type I restriction-modification system DNA methylase subunit